MPTTDTVPRLTMPTVAVLDALLAARATDPMWGLEICRSADLGPGTVYPILARLAALGWVEARDEEGPHPGRPGRRLYEFTAGGRKRAVGALAARRARLL
ncbi:PadR family transcriptional regulator [Streptomyces sp. NPDC020794]|uniref:PadR family transcriptional regulator n=1 Tax=unclassified Streptomyces TaxID=2593676 RepID=UPI0036F09099